MSSLLLINPAMTFLAEVLVEGNRHRGVGMTSIHPTATKGAGVDGGGFNRWGDANGN